jgi:hypothetical protein
MSNERPNTEQEIQALFRRAQAGDERTQEFASIHLASFEDDCAAAVRWQRTEGRAAVLGGAEPEDIRRETEGRIDEARERLRGRLVSLLACASAAGGPGREGERETG